MSGCPLPALLGVWVSHRFTTDNQSKTTPWMARKPIQVVGHSRSRSAVVGLAIFCATRNSLLCILSKARTRNVSVMDFEPVGFEAGRGAGDKVSFLLRGSSNSKGALKGIFDDH
jgi:hypothetical protein